MLCRVRSEVHAAADPTIRAGGSRPGPTTLAKGAEPFARVRALAQRCGEDREQGKADEDEQGKADRG